MRGYASCTRRAASATTSGRGAQQEDPPPAPVVQGLQQVGGQVCAADLLGHRVAEQPGGQHNAGAVRHDQVSPVDDGGQLRVPAGPVGDLRVGRDHQVRAARVNEAEAAVHGLGHRHLIDANAEDLCALHVICHRPARTD
ncbi:MAG: hypothetical protein A6D92_08350 [Symbiobacterium thermophilum]|uniref:Uncharacterized protein n=1 Tax=Symbiobacterium thermophilum TaxID=2734 RepID=A0A1Y2T489_SYMTR|nr:MAG: hypothetical protein A6D92_08350 [Symbiobacterium thermophilum]